jgi:deazaflavin-dependent oxidoreductase (nitroreductase family)
MPIIRLLNPIVGALLHSPLHGVLSRETMLITFTGRKTGQRYTTPVSYVRDGDRIRVFTGFRWWRNLRTRPDVEVLVAGATLQGTAEVVIDHPERVRPALEDFLRRVPRDEIYFTRGSDGEVELTQELDGAIHPIVLIEIRLAA